MKDMSDCEAEEVELETLASKSQLTRDELKRYYILHGNDEETAAWLADSGGLPQE
jgi:hypothetical protein